MKTLTIPVMLAFGWLLVCDNGSADAQYRYRVHYNPYTGRTTSAAAVHNPYTGRTMATSTSVNPYTGRVNASKSVVNPYTGKSANVNASYNPYTNRYAYNYNYRR